jgi:hypothetical protein
MKKTKITQITKIIKLAEDIGKPKDFPSVNVTSEFPVNGESPLAKRISQVTGFPINNIRISEILEKYNQDMRSAMLDVLRMIFTSKKTVFFIDELSMIEKTEEISSKLNSMSDSLINIFSDSLTRNVETLLKNDVFVVMTKTEKMLSPGTGNYKRVNAPNKINRPRETDTSDYFPTEDTSQVSVDEEDMTTLDIDEAKNEILDRFKRGEITKEKAAMLLREFAKNNKTIKLSQSQWESIGKEAGWIK